MPSHAFIISNEHTETTFLLTLSSLSSNVLIRFGGGWLAIDA